jgi:hypothetical protein
MLAQESLTPTVPATVTTSVKYDEKALFWVAPRFGSEGFVWTVKTKSLLSSLYEREDFPS